MTPLLRLEGISKRYGGVRALAGARLECERGRIHAVLGENGAGKSTLIKVIAGVVKPDAGTIELAGKPIVLATPAAANRAGIVSVFQDLPLSRRQMVEIAKALARDPKLLILDEATSALTAADVATVFTVLRQLREEGLAIVFISHRMHEIAELADDCSVYRNGCHVASFTAGSKSPSEIIEMMIGRDVKSVFPPRPAEKSTQPPA